MYYASTIEMMSEAPVINDDLPVMKKCMTGMNERGFDSIQNIDSIETSENQLKNNLNTIEQPI
jgi:hypothetical protein